jgi:hypothetical protein
MSVGRPRQGPAVDRRGPPPAGLIRASHVVPIGVGWGWRETRGLRTRSRRGDPLSPNLRSKGSDATVAVFPGCQTSGNRRPARRRARPASSLVLPPNPRAVDDAARAGPLPAAAHSKRGSDNDIHGSVVRRFYRHGLSPGGLAGYVSDTCARLDTAGTGAVARGWSAGDAAGAGLAGAKDALRPGRARAPGPAGGRAEAFGAGPPVAACPCPVPRCGGTFSKTPQRTGGRLQAIWCIPGIGAGEAAPFRARFGEPGAAASGVIRAHRNNDAQKPARARAPAVRSGHPPPGETR